MILGGALQRAGFEGDGPAFIVKGGVALELRLRTVARATKDLDLICTGPATDLVEQLQTALTQQYEGFTFRVKSEPEAMPNGAFRLEIALDYLGKSWGTVKVDVSTQAADGPEFELVPAISLEPFRLSGPDRLPCLALPFHVAQKLHAMTLPSTPERPNERFRDLLDLLLLEPLVTDREAVRRACRQVFGHRGTHPWPPFFEPPTTWVEPFTRMATEYAAPIADFRHATLAMRYFIHEVEPSASIYSEIGFDEGWTATAWYFVLDAHSRVQRLTTKYAEELLKVNVPTVPAELQRHPGGVCILGVVVLLKERRALFIERAAVRPIALQAEVQAQLVIGDAEWARLAEAVLRRAKVSTLGASLLGRFLSAKQGRLPPEISEFARVQPRHGANYILDRLRNSKNEPLIWDVENAQPVILRDTSLMQTE